MAVEAVFGGRTVWHSEIDKAASKVLAHRWPDVPNLGSITEIDWAEVEPVDVLCLGFPCQDVSAAGKRAGIKDGTRSGLWAYAADAIDALRPRYVVIENVRGLLSATAHRAVESDDPVVGDRSDRPVLRALGAVLGDLSDIGYDAVWATVAASAVGAPHRRERVFIVGTPAYTGHDAGCTEQGVEHEKQTRRVGQSSDRNRVASLAGSAPVGQHPGGASGAEAGAHSGDRSGDHRGERADGVELLPTPCVVDRLATGEMTLEEWDEFRRSQKERGVGSFGPRGDSLGAAILRVEEGTERPDYSTTKARRGGDEPGVALLPTPGTMDDREKRTTHAGGNLTLQGAIVGVNPVDVERHSKAGRTVSGDDVALLPTPSTHDKTGARSPESIARMDKPFANLNDTVVNDLGVERGPEPVDVSVGEDDSSVPVLPGNGGGEDALVGAADGDGVAVDVCGAENSHSSYVPAELAGTKYDLLPTPAASDGARGPDYAATQRNSSSYHTMVTLAAINYWGKYAPAIARWERIVGPAPAPTEPNKNGNPRLSAAFSEWLMGWPAGWVTDPAIGISRNDQLRILGNGVVTAQAQAALRYLLSVTHD